MGDASSNPAPVANFKFNQMKNVNDIEVKDFIEVKTIISKCEHCNQENGVHKMSCPTQKATVNIADEVKAYYDQMDKEVHQNKSNLNQ